MAEVFLDALVEQAFFVLEEITGNLYISAGCSEDSGGEGEENGLTITPGKATIISTEGLFGKKEGPAGKERI